MLATFSVVIRRSSSRFIPFSNWSFSRFRRNTWINPSMLLSRVWLASSYRATSSSW